MRSLALVVWLCAWAAQADEITLSNGDRLSGTPVSLRDGELTVDTELLGSLQLPFDRVVEVRGEGGPRDLPALAASLTPPEKIWSGRLRAGASFERGNSNTDASHAGIELERRRGIHRLSLDAGYRGERQFDDDTGKGLTTARDLYGGLKLDRFFGDELYGFAQSRAERDGVANLSLRTINGVGLGWQIRDDPDSSASVEAGLSWVREEFDRPSREDDFLSGSVAWKLARVLAVGATLFHDGRWYPSFEDERDHLVETRSGLRLPLTAGLFAESAVRWKWDSTPARGKERQDTEYTLSLGYGF